MIKLLKPTIAIIAALSLFACNHKISGTIAGNEYISPDGEFEVAQPLPKVADNPASKQNAEAVDFYQNAKYPADGYYSVEWRKITTKAEDQILNNFSAFNKDRLPVFMQNRLRQTNLHSIGDPNCFSSTLNTHPTYECQTLVNAGSTIVAYASTAILFGTDRLALVQTLTPPLSNNIKTITQVNWGAYNNFLSSLKRIK